MLLNRLISLLHTWLRTSLKLPLFLPSFFLGINNNKKDAKHQFRQSWYPSNLHLNLAKCAFFWEIFTYWKERKQNTFLTKQESIKDHKDKNASKIDEDSNMKKMGIKVNECMMIDYETIISLDYFLLKLVCFFGTYFYFLVYF